MSSIKPRLLIVDDDESILDLLFEAMTGYGYTCVAAKNAEQAVEILQHQSFELVLLDILLPGQSGVSLLKQITSTYPEIGTVMLTAVNEVEVAVESMKAGALDYITKPFELKKVDDALHNALVKKACAAGSSSGNADADIDALEAIARGVETRQDLLDIHNEKVIQQTVEVARRMGFPEYKIKQWLALRFGPQSDIIKKVTTSISRLVDEPSGDDL
jgi:DNA-binding NtrC family response regulator